MCLYMDLYELVINGNKYGIVSYMVVVIFMSATCTFNIVNLKFQITF